MSVDRRGWIGLLETAAGEHGLELTNEQLVSFRVFGEELLDWNQRLNLTALTSGEEVAIKHFLDSLLCLRAMQALPGSSLVDVGSGGGFPGVPLAIVHPEVRVTLLEAAKKKAEFLEHAVKTLGLSAVVLWKRAEDAGRDISLRESFDYVVARAVAPLAVLAEYCLPLCRPGGRFVAMKGPEGRAEAEAAAAGRAIDLLGGDVSGVDEYELPFGMGRRSLVIVRKTGTTPVTYPRRPGIPSKRPL